MSEKDRLRQVIDGLSDEKARQVLEFLGVRPEPEPVLTTTHPPSHPAVSYRMAREEAHGGSHHSQMFYLKIFIGLAIITLVEIWATAWNPISFRITALIVMSAAKFALVAMFFMHLKGDRPLFSLLFVAPLFLAMFVFVALVGLFRNF